MASSTNECTSTPSKRSVRRSLLLHPAKNSAARNSLCEPKTSQGRKNGNDTGAHFVGASCCSIAFPRTGECPNDDCFRPSFLSIELVRRMIRSDCMRALRMHVLAPNRESPPKYNARAPSAQNPPGDQNPFGDSKPSGDRDTSSSNPFGDDTSRASNPFGEDTPQTSSNPFGDAAAAATNPFGDEGSVTLILDDNNALHVQLCTNRIMFVWCARTWRCRRP